MRKFSEKKDLPNSDIGRFLERKFRAARETLKIPKKKRKKEKKKKRQRERKNQEETMLVRMY